MKNIENHNKVLEIIKQDLLQAIDKHRLKLPMLPEIASKVVRLTQNPDSGATDLSKLIQSDQTLASHVMRIANSAAYSPNSTIVSLQQAITRLGIKQIADIALAASMNSSMFNTPGYEKHIKEELKFSLSAGLWAKEIARQCRKNVETSFLSGLLHDIGCPIALQAILKSMEKLSAKIPQESVLQLEKQLQKPCGVAVTKQWEMPDSVINTIAFFDCHNTPHSTQLQTKIAVAGAQFAKHFFQASDNKTTINEDTLKSLSVLKELDLYPEDIEKLMEKEDNISSALKVMSP